MARPTMKRTGQTDGCMFEWTNGERSQNNHRGGHLEIVDDGDRTRLDVTAADRGTRVIFGLPGDAYGEVAATVTRALWNAETDDKGNQRDGVTEEDYRDAVLKALGVGQDAL